MSRSRRLTPTDHLIGQFDRMLRTLTPNNIATARVSPAREEAETVLTDAQKRHSGGLMRVNHSGEVCAQALYQGQALTARLPQVRQDMEQAAAEESDHLAWCEERLRQLDSRPSLLNPAWHSMAFCLGAGAGLISDRASLGFVAATEDQVCEHLQEHLRSLPEDDKKSRAIVDTMLEDERKHGLQALAAGGWRFPRPVKRGMRLLSKVMTTLSYRV